MYENSAWHQRSVSHMFFPTLDSDRFSKLDKERFPPRSNLTRNKALEKKEDKTISLICSSFFQMIKRRKMMSSLIPFLARTGLDLSTLLVLQDFQAWNKQKYLYQSYPSDFKAIIAIRSIKVIKFIKCQRHQSCQSHKSCYDLQGFGTFCGGK